MNECHTNREFENTWEGTRSRRSRRSVGDMKTGDGRKAATLMEPVRKLQN